MCSKYESIFTVAVLCDWDKKITNYITGIYPLEMSGRQTRRFWYLCSCFLFGHICYIFVIYLLYICYIFVTCLLYVCYIFVTYFLYICYIFGHICYIFGHICYIFVTYLLHIWSYLLHICYIFLHICYIFGIYLLHVCYIFGHICYIFVTYLVIYVTYLLHICYIFVTYLVIFFTYLLHIFLNFEKYLFFFEVVRLLSGLLAASGLSKFLAPETAHVWRTWKHLLRVSATKQHPLRNRFTELYMHSLVTSEHFFSQPVAIRFPCSVFLCPANKRIALLFWILVPSIDWYGVARWRSGLRHYATNRQVAGLIPDVVIGIFQWYNPSGLTMVLRSTQPLTEMSTRCISWGVKATGA
jgi:hypothetical protein